MPKAVNRDKIAQWVVILSILGTVLLALIGLYLAHNSGSNSFDNIQFIFISILPLWGTWMGTVLAYYFSKENFESASASNQKLVETFAKIDLASMKSKDVMVPFTQIDTPSLKQEFDIKNAKISEILGYYKNSPFYRFPVIDSKRIGFYVIHQSMMEKFIASQFISGHITTENMKDLTIQSLLEKYPELRESVRFANINSNLKEVQSLMNESKHCQDVFITENGRKDEPVLGWITNVTITEKAKL